MFGPQGGKQEREALAAGCVVLSPFQITYLRSYFPNLPARNNFIDECPIVHVSPSTISDILLEIIPDVAKRSELSQRGRSYVASYHNVEVLATRLMEDLDQPHRNTTVDPCFFWKYKQEEHLLNVYHRWTQEVVCSDWYHEQVKNCSEASPKSL